MGKSKELDPQRLKERARVLFTEYILTSHYYMEAIYKGEPLSSGDLYNTLKDRISDLDRFVKKYTHDVQIQSFGDLLTDYFNAVAGAVLSIKAKDTPQIEVSVIAMSQRVDDIARYLSNLNQKQISYTVISNRLSSQNRHLLDVIMVHDEGNITLEEKYYNEYYLSTLVVADTISHGLSSCKKKCNGGGETQGCAIFWIIVFVLFIFVVFIIMYFLRLPCKEPYMDYGKYTTFPVTTNCPKTSMMPKCLSDMSQSIVSLC